MRIGIDIGGTFTDFVAFDGSGGGLRTLKLLSTPSDPSRAVLEGLRRLAGAGSGEDGGTPDGEAEAGDGRDADPAPPAGTRIVHGSTVATNAVLERKGARTALVVTRGFRDVLAIGRQARPALYDFLVDPPTPLVPPERCFEVTERVDRRGDALLPLAEDELPGLETALGEAGVESVAVVFLFSFLRPDHEAAVAGRLREAGFFVSASSEVLPEFREYERASTTAIDAFVTPVLDRYIGRLAAGLRGGELRIMLSNGGSARAEEARRHGVRSILSGPAGGVVGALHVARRAGREAIIALDMGGTSTDVSLARGEPGLTTEAEIDGLPIRVPVIDIHTVGSGGGSVARADPGGALRVGPESAGAEPGPACYGRGGEAATVTDANVVLGRLPPDRFLGGRLPLDAGAAGRALDRLAREAGIDGGDGLSAAERAALGVLRVADAHMERALRVISVERGHDPEDYALVAFGGAGGLHAVELARSLRIREVLVPAHASTLSALGMLVAPVLVDDVRTVMLPGDTPFEELERRMRPLAEAARGAVRAEGVPEERVSLHPELDVRYVGQSYELRVPFGPAFRAAFDREHARAYGHSDPEAAVEVVSLRLRATGELERPRLPAAEPGEADASGAIVARRRVVGGGGTGARTTAVADVPLYDGGRLRPGHRLDGPAVIAQPDTTVFLTARDALRVDGRSNLWIEVGGRG